MCRVLVSLVSTVFCSSGTILICLCKLQFEAVARRHRGNIPNLQKTGLLSAREMKVKIMHVHL